jgi:hypothetical protein
MAEIAEEMSVSAVEEVAPQGEEVTSSEAPVAPAAPVEPSEFSLNHFTGCVFVKVESGNLTSTT